jgi:hypothetical protein
MRYPRALFAIPLEFAQKMTRLAQQPYLDAVLCKTAFSRLSAWGWIGALMRAIRSGKRMVKACSMRRRMWSGRISFTWRTSTIFQHMIRVCSTGAALPASIR